MNNIVNMIDKYLNDIYFLKSFKSNVKEYITLENHYLELITILEQIKYEIEVEEHKFLEQLKNEIDKRLKGGWESDWKNISFSWWKFNNVFV